MKKNKFSLFLFFSLIFLSSYLGNWIWVAKGLLGLSAFIFLAFLLSQNKKQIDWVLILKCVNMQIGIALLALKVPIFGIIFQHISEKFVQIISYSKKGADFLLASFVSGTIESPLINFASIVLPSILFFSALTAILYHYQIIQKVVYLLAFLMKKTLKISGAESLAITSSIFLGPTESALLIRHYIPQMNKSQVMLLMTAGMATVSGSVLATYIYFLGGDDPIQQAIFAKHLMVASFINAPAAVLMGKILLPQTENLQEDALVLEKENTNTNVLEAIANGTSDGLRLAVNIAAMLLVVIALLAFINEFIFGELIGHYTGLNSWIVENTSYSGLSLEFIFAYLLSPFVYLMGVSQGDILTIAQLIGEKTVINEFVAYASLGKMKAAAIFENERSIVIATYVLCGFSNFSSIGIQVGGIGCLVPSKKAMLSQLGFRALLGASLACILTGIIAGMLV